MAPSTLLAPSVEPSGADSGDSDVQPICRVVLLDPRPERRAITGRLVERCSPLSVVGLAGSLGEAETQIAAERADVALVEIQMPVTQGLETIAALRARFPDLRIVVCSFHSDSVTREMARLHGADAYLMKPFDVEDLRTVVLGSVTTAKARMVADAPSGGGDIGDGRLSRSSSGPWAGPGSDASPERA